MADVKPAFRFVAAMVYIGFHGRKRMKINENSKARRVDNLCEYQTKEIIRILSRHLCVSNYAMTEGFGDNS